MKPPVKPDGQSEENRHTGKQESRWSRNTPPWSAAKSDILGGTHYIKRHGDVKWSFPWIRRTVIQPDEHFISRTDISSSCHSHAQTVIQPDGHFIDLVIHTNLWKWKRRGSWSHKVLSNFLLELLELNHGFLFCFWKILCSLRHPSIYSNKSSSPQELPLYTTSYDIYSCSSL